MTTQETSPNADPEREAQLESFRMLIEKAVWPVMQMRESGSYPIYAGGMLADTGLKLGSSSIRFEKYKDEHSQGVTAGGLRGIRGATHVARIEENQSVFGYRTRTTAFILTKHGEFKRSMRFGDDSMFGPTVMRDVKTEEIDTLVQFLASPHLKLDTLDAVMGLTDEEQASIVRQTRKRQEWRRQRLSRLFGIGLPGTSGK